MARTAITLPNPASRVWRGRCGRVLRSIRAMPAKCHPPRVSSAADRPLWFRAEFAMPVYTVHAPRGAGPEPFAATDKFEFVRDGFHFWAFVAGLIWLIYHRLWWALLGYVVLSIAGEVALSMLKVDLGARFVVMLLFALLMGFEAASLRRWTLSRGKWRQLDVVVADN